MGEASRRLKATVVVPLAAVLLAALALRLLLLSGPQTELEADEAVVGIMARHILEGERPVFYYMQPYLGSMEAYLAAGVFALLGSSTTALKLVPLAASLLFVALVFATGYQIGGPRTAISSGLYVAVPPAFLALWSLKARGGYIETLVLGQLLILVALRVGKRRAVRLWEAVSLGILGGIGIWTNPLVGVYLVPVAAYLALALRRGLIGTWLLPAALAALVGGYPLLEYNVRNGFATAEAMFGGTGALSEVPAYVFRFFRYSLPILAGLAQASSSQQYFWPAFRTSPAGWWPVALLLAVLFLLLVALRLGSLVSLIKGRENGTGGESLLLLVLVTVPAAFVLSKFRELVTEPRYLLPLYSAAPLLFVGVPRRRWVGRRVGPLLTAAIVVLNLWSIASVDAKLNLPDTAPGSVASNRLELASFLLSHGLDRVYTDYWIAYPLAFESGEQVVPSVTSGGFNRYLPYAYLVSVASDPAFVFIQGSEQEKAFLARLADVSATFRREIVSIYSVYWQVSPLDRVRP